MREVFRFSKEEIIENPIPAIPIKSKNPAPPYLNLNFKSFLLISLFGKVFLVLFSLSTLTKFFSLYKYYRLIFDLCIRFAFRPSEIKMLCKWQKHIPDVSMACQITKTNPWYVNGMPDHQNKSLVCQWYARSPK
jgi:hypothetical protein